MDVLPEEDADGGESRREDGGGDAPALLHRQPTRWLKGAAKPVLAG